MWILVCAWGGTHVKVCAYEYVCVQVQMCRYVFMGTCVFRCTCEDICKWVCVCTYMYAGFKGECQVICFITLDLIPLRQTESLTGLAAWHPVSPSILLSMSPKVPVFLAHVAMPAFFFFLAWESQLRSMLV